MSNDQLKKEGKQPGKPGETPGNGGGQGNPGGNPGGGHGQNNKITVRIRFQNKVVPISININQPVDAVLEEAIRATGNDLNSKDRFQLKLQNGTVLDPSKKIKDYPIQENTLLVLGLLAGGGGNYSFSLSCH